MSEQNKFVARTIAALQKSSGMAGSQSVVYVALGDSVTAGWLEHGILDSDKAYPALFRARLAQLYPHAMISVLNGGLGGDNVDGLLVRLDRDALRHDPQIITVCVGLNDARKGKENVDAFRAGLIQLVERIQTESQADLILITPNTRGDQWQDDGTVAEYVRVVRTVAREKGVGLADVYAIYSGALRTGVDNPGDLLSNRVSHPTREGHHIFANALISFFQP